jgi:dCTP diphosphatase
MSRYNLESAVARLLQFRGDRDWGRFHRPKELAAGLAIEAAELQELFLWREGESAEAVRNDKQRMGRIREELADVTNFVLMLAHDLDIDLAAAVDAKIDANAKKYPVAEFRGIARKAD